MMIENATFYFFSCLALISGLMVIIAKNPVRAVLSLILSFVSMAALWLLLEQEFLAITLILVYVGAVMVLFLFVVMMLDIEGTSLREGFAKFLPLGICVSVLVVLGLVTAVGPEEFGLQKYKEPLLHTENFSNIEALGEVLYTRYLYPFEIAGVLLLVAILASISLTFKGERKERIQNKAIDPARQNQVSKKDRLQVISMKTEKDTV